VSHVFLTHSDFDHVGGLAALPGAAVYLSTDEGQMVDGTTTRSFGLLRNSLYGREWTPCRDGEVVNAGSIKVVAIATPGHTPGSMSYLIEDR
jgi:glyoxylase-like metal-dependent hydrolase (beta-lactamase superfamily II)